jgi:hypothetical protein
VPEWLKGPAWKAGIGATLSRVRIPSSLLRIKRPAHRAGLLFFYIFLSLSYSVELFFIINATVLHL